MADTKANPHGDEVVAAPSSPRDTLTPYLDSLGGNTNTNAALIRVLLQDRDQWRRIAAERSLHISRLTDELHRLRSELSDLECRLRLEAAEYDRS